MDYKRLGQSGVKVSRICLGTAFRSRLFSQNFDHAACELEAQLILKWFLLVLRLILKMKPM